MSYCRWSSDDFRCDLYCYEDASGGWTTHVAGLRYPEDGPRPPSVALALSDFDAYRAARDRWNARADEVPMVTIGLPCDGQTFNDPTLADFRARLMALREAGYRFPDHVLADVDEELAS